MHIPVTLKKIFVLAALFAAALPFAAVAESASTTDELVSEYKAECLRNKEEASALRAKLDEAYASLQQSRTQSDRAMTAAIVTAVVCVGAMGVVLVVFLRSKNKAQKDLVAMNERLDRQWHDLQMANVELTKVNKDLSAALAKLTGKQA